MVRKKMEGNEEQRRAAAREARGEGKAPSELKETTGASKQRTHLGRHEPHEEKIASIHEGKQHWRETVDRSRPAPLGPDRTFVDHPDYTEEHERVFAALMELQEEHDGEAVYLDEIADASALPREQTEALLHDLISVQRLVTELQGTDSPDLGPRYEAKPRL